ncbi:ATP-binding protein [Sphingobacterium sp. BN32]|uniref:ATP-binding protein n=1 Tax=Sphingobacterium sp. BN32 TaxID=3058432 RepID=UPI003463E540
MRRVGAQTAIFGPLFYSLTIIYALEPIFDRFYKVDERYHGSGLGLAICRSIVNQMDGRIWVESTEGEGATFFIEIPIANV